MAIIPTVGRKVYFYESDKQVEPIDATIIKVWASPEMATERSAVNLAVVDPHSAQVSPRSSVVVGDALTNAPHYRWMPYQLAQAGFTCLELLIAITLLCVSAVALAGGHAGHAKPKGESKATTVVAKPYTVPSAGKWEKK